MFDDKIYNLGARVCKLLKRLMRNCVALQYLREIVRYQDVGVHCSQLRRNDDFCSIHSREFDVTAAALPAYMRIDRGIAELPIPISDIQTVNDARTAYAQYRSQYAQAKIDNSEGEYDELIDKIEFCRDFLNDVVTKNGKIKNFKSQAQDDYKSVRRHMLRLIEKTTKINRRLGRILKAHLEIGTIMIWHSHI